MYECIITIVTSHFELQNTEAAALGAGGASSALGSPERRMSYAQLVIGQIGQALLRPAFGPEASA